MQIDIEGSSFKRTIREAVRLGLPPEDFVIIDPRITSHVLPFNVLAADAHFNRFTVVQALVAAMMRCWPTAFEAGARMESMLTSGATLLAEHNLSLRDFPRICEDEDLCACLADGAQDPQARSFFYHYRTKRQFGDWIESSWNKVSALAHSPYLGPMLESPTCTDFSKLMDEKTVLVRLDEAHLQGHLRLIATLLLHRIEMDSYKRDEGASPYPIYLDEGQEYPTPSLHRLVARRQKRGIGMAIFFQVRRQFDPEMFSAIIGNVRTRIAFGLGDVEDAEVMAKQLFQPTGDRIKTQKTEKLLGLFDVPVGEPKFWSLAEEISHFAGELRRAVPGEAVLHLLDSGEVYWLTTPLVPDLDDIPQDVVKRWVMASMEANLLPRSATLDERKRREEYLAAFAETARKLAHKKAKERALKKRSS